MVARQLSPSTHATALFDAFENGVPVAPPSELDPGLDLDRAYDIQRQVVRSHEASGRTVVGRKIGLTSPAIQQQLGVSEPDYGVVLDSHVFADGARLGRDALAMIAPRLEAEIAFVLERPLEGDRISVEQVLGATRALVPVWELIDSRVEDWRITLADTVADNASCLGVVVGEEVAVPAAGVLPEVALRLERDGELRAEGRGAAVLGDPARAVAWLAAALARHGERLEAGELILSGSFTAAVDALPGSYRASFSDGIGEVTVAIDE